ncbi:hypothetical protein AB0M48_15360 [Lentzea sp. NPDC051208]|uniref:hypothetical protein n=1 Tax=Lentzea sp. NPDC051208 TaxID=3154642 RepID=UPI003428EEE5
MEPEARIQDDYRTGRRQFEGELEVTAGTDDESAMQIFGNDGDGATTLKYGVYGTLKTASAEHQWRNVHFHRK